jgi:hypothetical protein
MSKSDRNVLLGFLVFVLIVGCIVSPHIYKDFTHQDVYYKITLYGQNIPIKSWIGTSNRGYRPLVDRGDMTFRDKTGKYYTISGTITVEPLDNN